MKLFGIDFNIFFDLFFNGIISVATVALLYIAYKALDTWKKEHIGKKQMELAFELEPDIKKLYYNYLNIRKALNKKGDSLMKFALEVSSFEEYKDILLTMRKEYNSDDIALYLGSPISYHISMLYIEESVLEKVFMIVRQKEEDRSDDFVKDTKRQLRDMDKRFNFILKVLGRYLSKIKYEYTKKELKDYYTNNNVGSLYKANKN
ncbi:MAG: hypothetical protein OIF36_03835 [Alphaproteobacteria bacterium]|nr:hypothetical protein [Alphaproteobacteria bacterium]